MLINFGCSRSFFRNEIQGRKAKIFKKAFDPKELSWSDFNKVVSRAKIEEDAFAISHKEIVPKERYVESYYDIGTLRYRLIKPAVYEYLRRGATLIINRIHNEPEVEKFSRIIAGYTDRQVVTSAYLAFGGIDSYKLHWDTRDVFALQVKGRKRWVVYKPTFENPIHTQQSKDLVQEKDVPSGIPDIDVILEPGDVFYLPRGWWHNPSPLGEESLHLAIGTFPALVINYVSYLMSHLQGFAPARSALSASWGEDSKTLELVVGYLNNIVINQESYDDFLCQWIGGHRIESNLALEVFGRDGADLALSGRIRLCANSFYCADHGFVVANGTKVNLDPKSLAVIEKIHGKFQISLGDLLGILPDYDGEKVKSLIYDLCRQDILEWLPRRDF